ncbi:MAG: hypothetical protein IJE78_00485 [Bacteroidaceae bacterium]|nr:hypothetical protein [Bacteroidaceae bacterium]MBQ2855590.1 hypothetical protein [Bacteroidaceae bacterium]
MKTFIKKEGGEIVKKTLKEIVIRKNGKQTFNPSEEMVLADGWVEYVAPTPVEPSEAILLERARQRKLRELHNYDESKEVNNCVIVYQGQEIDYWASKEERNDLKNAIRDCMALGRITYRLDLRDKGISVTIPCESLLQMMAVLEVYAVDCYNRTTDHEFFIKSLETMDEIEAYEFRGNGYPEIPRFEL